ncbi:hypothetical protein B0H10DRAFT_2051287, partial [Mycena sp. CBHHK59/15]
EEREEKERERAEHEEQTERKDNELRALRSSLTSLREELADLKDAHSTLSRSTAQTIASQKSQITTLTRQSTLLEDEVAQFKLIAQERSRTIDEIQVQFQDLSTSSNNTAAEQENNDMVVVREELHRQAAYLRTLESTNAKLTSELTVLRERHVSVEVLREEKRGLERKLRTLEEMRARVVKLEAQVEGRNAKPGAARNQQSAVPSTSTPSKTPVSVTHSLSALRLEHAQLLEDHGATVALLRSKEAELANAESRITDAQEAIEKLESQINTLNDKAYRCEQRTLLAEREVGFMKALVKKRTKEGVSMDDARTEQVQQLESLLEGYKSANLRLTQQLDEVVDREPVSITTERKQELEKERTARLQVQEALDAALSESKSQLEKIEQLEQELFELGGEIAGGRHVPPEGGARAEGVPDGDHLVPKESWDAVCKERDDLLGVVKQKETRLKRLKEEFKESIASLLGVKLAFFPSGQVRVTSSANMQLIAQGDGGPEDLPNLMAYWVGTEQCIPGFLASVTLELYDKCKNKGDVT